MVFDNGFNLPFGVSESCSELKKIVQKEMLKQAIDLHFEKEQTLFLQGIKALSLFFIDNLMAIKHFRANYLLVNLTVIKFEKSLII